VRRLFPVTNKTPLLLFLGMLVGLASGVFPAGAEQLQVEVRLHLEKLPLDEQNYLAGLGDELSALFNDHTWSADGYKYQLPVTIDLFPDKYSLYSIYHKYSAGVMVATKSGIQLRDTRWDFRLTRDQPLHVGDPYDTFTGLMEFYIWVSLGFENDLLKPGGGQPYYDKALSVADAARFESLFVDGWDYRRNLARDLSLDTAYRNIRQAAFHARAGIFYAEKDDCESALPYLSRTVELLLTISPLMMELHRDDHILRFIDAPRFAAALATCGSQDLLEKMSQWDADHPELYR